MTVHQAVSVDCSENDCEVLDCFVADMVAVAGPRKKSIQVVGGSAAGILAGERSVVGGLAVISVDIVVVWDLVVPVAASR